MRPPSEGADWCSVLADLEEEFDPLDYAEKPTRVWFTMGELIDADLIVGVDDTWMLPEAAYALELIDNRPKNRAYISRTPNSR